MDAETNDHEKWTGALTQTVVGVIAVVPAINIDAEDQGVEDDQSHSTQQSANRHENQPGTVSEIYLDYLESFLLEIEILPMDTHFLRMVRVPADIMKTPPQMPMLIQPTNSWSEIKVATCLT